jgi:hypothetical protein
MAIGNRAETILPVEVVFSPSWWHANAGITFDRDFFFHPARRVEDEKKMEKLLFDKWGAYGLGADKEMQRPEIGAVHLASGFLLSEMFGCQVVYRESEPPAVVPLGLDRLDESIFESAFQSPAFSAFESMCDALQAEFGYLTGDVNWSGVLNIALDLRGQDIFLDLHDDPDSSRHFFQKIATTIRTLTDWVQSRTGSSSILVNRNVRHFSEPVFLHSECSNTMISIEDYERFLLPVDKEWSAQKRPFGVHHCGNDPHRFARSFSKIPGLAFLDVGWGGDGKVLRAHLPRTFFNMRMSPVEIVSQDPAGIRKVVTRLVEESNDPWLTGICCINMDDQIADANVDAIFDTVAELRRAIGEPSPG